MKPQYINLTDGRRVRIIFNMNALGAFTSLTGIEMVSIGNKLDVTTLRAIAWCCAVEGEATEGNNFGLTEIEFGRLINMQGIIDFSTILAFQSGNEGQKKKPETGMLRRILSRKKG